MKTEKIKKGDVVCVVDVSRKDEPYIYFETTVSKVGHKYITIESPRLGIRFHTDSLRSEQFEYRLFLGTKEDVIKQIEERKSLKEMLRAVVHYFEWNEPDAELIKETYDKIMERTKNNV